MKRYLLEKFPFGFTLNNGVDDLVWKQEQLDILFQTSDQPI